MMYLFLTFIFVLLMFVSIYSLFNIFATSYYKKQKFYDNVNKNNKYVMFYYIIKFANVIVPLIKTIKFKFFIDYVNKIEKMLKIYVFEYNINAYNFISLQIMAMILGFVLSFLLFGLDVLFLMCFGVLFAILPYLKLYENYNKITEEIVKQIPDISNLISIMIFSGIDFNSSLNKLILILDGTLINEIKNILNKVSLGIDIKIAFRELAEKYKLLQLDMFVKTINMSLETGTGLSENLIKIAEQISNDNISAVEKKAHEAPVKMLLPMTILILPTIFILLFAPFILSFFKSGSLF